MRGRADTTGVEEGGNFEMLPPGWYVAEITDVEDSETKNGDYMAKIKLAIVGGEYTGFGCRDVIVISNNPTSPGYKILGRTKHFLHMIGQPYEGKFDYDTDEWMWKKVEILVGHKEWNGKLYPKVDEYQEMAIVTGESPPPAAVEEEPDITDGNSDDIPF